MACAGRAPLLILLFAAVAAGNRFAMGGRLKLTAGKYNAKNVKIAFYGGSGSEGKLSAEQESAAEKITQETYKGIGGNIIQNRGIALSEYYNCWLLAEMDGQVEALILAWVMDLSGSCEEVSGAKIGTVASLNTARAKTTLKTMASKVLSAEGLHRWWVEVSPPLFYSWIKLGPVVQDPTVAKQLLCFDPALSVCSKGFVGDMAKEDLFGCYNRAIGSHTHEKILLGCPPPFQVSELKHLHLDPDSLLRTKNPYTGGRIANCIPNVNTTAAEQLEKATDQQLKGSKWVANGGSWQVYLQFVDGYFNVKTWTEGDGGPINLYRESQYCSSKSWYNYINGKVFIELELLGTLVGYLAIDPDFNVMRFLSVNYNGDLKEAWPGAVFHKFVEEPSAGAASS